MVRRPISAFTRVCDALRAVSNHEAKIFKYLACILRDAALPPLLRMRVVFFAKWHK
jgi:hypothetical protein